MTRRSDGEAGFTLLELLVGLALFGLVSVALFHSLRFGLRAWERVESHSNGGDAVAEIQALLRRHLERAYPLWIEHAATPHVDFTGTADRIAFLAPAPQALIAGGLARLNLRVRHGNGRWRLELIAQPHPGDDGGGVLREILIGGLHSLQIAYFGADEAEAPGQWQPLWRDRGALPRLIRIRAAFPPGDRRLWPDLVVAPRLTADATCAYDPVTKFCRGR